VLAPNDFAVPGLALNLREWLQEASKLLIDLDGEIMLHWNEEKEVAAAIAKGRLKLSDDDVYERHHEFDAVGKRFMKRVKEIKREAKGEEKDRLEKGQRRSPEGLNDYLFASANDIMVSNFYPVVVSHTDDVSLQVLSKRDIELPSRYVVENPFTILARLTAGMESFNVPELMTLKDKKWEALNHKQLVRCRRQSCRRFSKFGCTEHGLSSTAKAIRYGPDAGNLVSFIQSVEVVNKNVQEIFEAG